jgi:hypothetical protein
MSESTFYKIGLAFRQAVLENKVSPDRYSAILLDLGGQLENVNPALSELSRRKIFKDLPLTGSAAEKILARDKLACDIKALYRHEVAAELIDLVEGVLGFVALSEDHLDDDNIDQYDELLSSSELMHESAHPYSTNPDDTVDYTSCPDRNNGDALGSSQYFAQDVLAERPGKPKRTKGLELSALGQIGRTLLYQLPPFFVFLTTKILLAVQASNAGPAGYLNPSDLIYEYINTMPWLLVSFSSVAFWAGLFQAMQTRRASFGLELSIGTYYVVTLGIATPSLLATVEESYVGSVYQGAVILFAVNILAARVLMLLFSWRLRS